MRIKQIDFGKTDANNEFIDKGSEKYLDSFYDYEKYNIVGFEHGLREYNSEDNTMKNNTTREYESLDII